MGEFQTAIWDLVRQVPPGRATTYGDLAELNGGVRGGARAVGQAMRSCPNDVPWWRVVHEDGSMKGGFASEEQRLLLAEEGVPLTDDWRVDWRSAGPRWAPGG